MLEEYGKDGGPYIKFLDLPIPETIVNLVDGIGLSFDGLKVFRQIFAEQTGAEIERSLRTSFSEFYEREVNKARNL